MMSTVLTRFSQSWERRRQASDTLADAGSSVDGRDEEQEGQYGAILEDRVGLAGLRGYLWAKNHGEQDTRKCSNRREGAVQRNKLHQSCTTGTHSRRRKCDHFRCRENNVSVWLAVWFKRRAWDGNATSFAPGCAISEMQHLDGVCA